MTRNSIYQLIALLVKRGAQVAVFVMISRMAGSEYVGQYAFALALVSALTLLAAVGLPSLVVRETARNTSAANFYFVNVLILRSIISIAASGLVIVIALVSGKGPAVVWALSIFGLTILPSNLIDQASNSFTGVEQMQYVPILALLQWVPMCVAAAILLHLHQPLWTVMLAYVISFAVAAVVGMRLVDSKLAAIRWHELAPRTWFRLLGESVPLAVATFLGLVYFRIGTIILSFMRGDRAVGWFSAGFHVNEALQLVPAALMGAALPVLSRQTSRDSSASLKAIIYYLMVVALPVAFGATLLARQFSVGIFGPDFENTAGVLRVVIWAIIPIFLNFAIGTLLIATDRQSIIARNAFLCCLLSVPVNILFIHRVGYRGAAWATLSVETALLIFNVVIAWPYLRGFDALRKMWKPLVGTAVVTAIVMATRSWLNVIVVVGISGVTYFVVLFLLGGLTVDPAVLAIRRERAVTAGCSAQQ